LQSKAATEVDDALEMANDVLRSDQLGQLEDLTEARDAVKSLSNTRLLLARFRKENPNIKHAEVSKNFPFLLDLQIQVTDSIIGRLIFETHLEAPQ
jgi:hypothetical protein